jgi:hypothetical protein
VLPRDPDSGVSQLSYYDTGVGSLGQYGGPSNRLLSLSDKVLGGAWGAGFEANIEEAVTFLAHNYRPEDDVFVFGFSRGAAQARGLTRFIDWMGGLPAKGDAYFIPLFFRDYANSCGTADPADTKTAGGHRPREDLRPFRVTLLGVWDTVMALGSRFRALKKTSSEKRSFHVGSTPAECVLHARQALAVDEERYDFRPEIWKGTRAAPGQTLEQRWFPGVHSNVGGGYVDDGLANLSYHWMLREAETLGLATDSEYTKHFRPYPQDRLYNSKTVLYRGLEAIRFRWGRGVRPLVGHPDSSNLELDRSVIHRLISRPEDHDEMDSLYRPGNLLELLATKPDLGAYLASIEGLRSEYQTLPEDVHSAIATMREGSSSVSTRQQGEI